MCGGMIERRLNLHLHSLVSPPPENGFNARLKNRNQTGTEPTPPPQKKGEGEGKAPAVALQAQSDKAEVGRVW